MNGWRPDGWKNPYEHRPFGRPFPFESYPPLKIARDAFEVGADRLLKALKEKGTWMTPDQMRILAPERNYAYGHLVFIPEDKETAATTIIDVEEKH